MSMTLLRIINFYILLFIIFSLLIGCSHDNLNKPILQESRQSTQDELLVLALKTIGSLRQEVNSLLPEKARLAEEISRLQSTIDDQQHLMTLLNNQRTDLLEKFSLIEQNNQALSKSHEELEKSLNTALSRLTEVDSINKRISQSDPTKTYKSLREQNAWLKKRLDEFRFQLIQEQSKVSVLEEELKNEQNSF